MVNFFKDIAMKLKIAILSVFALISANIYSQEDEALLQNGLYAFNEDNFTKAIADLSRYVETNTDNAIAYNTLGRAYSYKTQTTTKQ